MAISFSSSSLVGYDAPSRQVFVVKAVVSSGDLSNESSGDSYIYNLDLDSWSKGISSFWHAPGAGMTNIVVKGTTAKLSYLVDLNANEGRNIPRGDR